MYESDISYIFIYFYVWQKCQNLQIRYLKFLALSSTECPDGVHQSFFSIEIFI